MEINLDLGLVNGQFDESNVRVDADMNVSGVLSLSGLVDDEWSAAFDAAAPPEAPWTLDDTPAIHFGPIPVREFSAQVARLRKQIAAANESVESERHRRAMAAHIDAQERERAHRQAIDALSSVFGRRLSSLDDGERQAA
jgi:hypothetical protein